MTRSARASLVLALLATACRDGAKETAAVVRIVPSPLAAAGCSGPDQAFAPPQTPSAIALAVLGIGPSSQIAAAGDSETLYATGDLAQVVAIDVTGAPAETELVAPGTIAALIAGLGVAAPPELGGICVLDAGSLLVVEMTSNTILKVDRAVPDTVELWAGSPSTTPGFADGPAALPTAQCPLGAARFSFTTPTALCPTGSTGSVVYVADPGNHALRVVAAGCVTTLCGLGSAFSFDGSIEVAGFDTPVGLSTRCSGSLLVAEAGGHKLRELALGATTFFGPSGTVSTLAGDGTQASTQGDGELAQLAAPVSPLATSAQDVYWIDSATGILRRMRGSLDTVDCPLAVDCASALADFTPGGVVSLTQTPGGLLYVLDAAAGTLYRVTP